MDEQEVVKAVNSALANVLSQTRYGPISALSIRVMETSRQQGGPKTVWARATATVRIWASSSDTDVNPIN